MTEDKNELGEEKKESDKGIGINKWRVWCFAFVLVTWWKWDDVQTWFN